MKSYLKKAGYIFNADLGIWVANGFEGISYSDGEEVECRIAQAIDSVTDVSVMSSELKQHCIDWPSTYHLSSVRSNILRPFENILFNSDVLEIGSGCGAITRYLGEIGARVVALEGTSRRASITRSRTRDLKKIEVVTDSFNNFKCNRRFDIITLIGVLEYANIFEGEEFSHISMLKRAKEFLKPNGRLIIAIENQLGLKYFSGAPEDHLGEAMIGLEGRYKANSVKTFGMETLNKLLKHSGYKSIHFLAPYPDYKLPTSIITEQGFLNANFDSAALARKSIKNDIQMPQLSNFSLELTYPEIISNNLGLHLANSFLVVASIENIKTLNEAILAFHYNTDRSVEFCKETLFVVKDERSIVTKYKKISKAKKNHNNKLIKFFINKSSKYFLGNLLSSYFTKIITQPGWRSEDIVRYVLRYIKILKDFGAFSSSNNLKLSVNTKIPGTFFDVTPQNIIIQSNSKPKIIDKEWATQMEIELGFLLFRGFVNLTFCTNRFAQSADFDSNTTCFEFLNTIFKKAGLHFNELDFRRYEDLDHKISKIIFGKVRNNFSDWKNYILPIHTEITSLKQGLTDRDTEITSLKQGLTDRDTEITSLKQGLTDRDTEITSLKQGLTDRDTEITSLKQGLTDRDTEITSLKQGLTDRDTEITSLKQGLTDRDTEITSLKQGLTDRDTEITSLKQGLTDRDTEITSLKQGLTDRDTEITSLKQGLTDRDTEITSLKQGLTDRDTEITSLKQGLTDRDTEITSLKQGLTDRDTEITSLKQGLTDRDTEITSLKQGLTDRDTEITSLKQGLTDRDTEITSLKTRPN